MINAEVILGSGARATIEPDPFVPGAVQLFIDGTPQSQVNLKDPSDLFYEYVRRMGHVIDDFRSEREPVTALHLGGGAFTLPRYIEATRPGSRQQVIELDGDLIDFVKEHIPLPKRASVRVRRGDAREKLASLPKGLLGNVDVIIVDVFSGARTPAHLTSTEFYEALKPFLRSNGIVLLNAADGHGQAFVRGQIATLQQVFSRVVAVGEPQVFKGRRFGNIVIVAGLDEGTNLHRLMSAGPHPARMLENDELSRFVAGAKAVTDESATPSPEPPVAMFGAGV